MNLWIILCWLMDFGPGTPTTMYKEGRGERPTVRKARGITEETKQNKTKP